MQGRGKAMLHHAALGTDGVRGVRGARAVAWHENDDEPADGAGRGAQAAPEGFNLF